MASPKELGLPLMLKAPHEGSTIGISKVNRLDDMQAGFDDCARYDDTVLAEEFISGRELTVPVMGAGRDARALPIVEIRAPQGNYDYEHKYFSDDTAVPVPGAAGRALTAAHPGAGGARPTARWAAAAGRASTSCCAPPTTSPSCWRSIPRPA